MLAAVSQTRSLHIHALITIEKYLRRSWVVWDEDGKYPDLIIELLSDSTADDEAALPAQLQALGVFNQRSRLSNCPNLPALSWVQLCAQSTILGEDGEL